MELSVMDMKDLTLLEEAIVTVELVLLTIIEIFGVYWWSVLLVVGSVVLVTTWKVFKWWK